MWAPLDQGHSGTAAQGLTRGSPDREGEPASGPQHPSALLQGRCRIGHQHVAPATDHAVHACFIQIHLLGIQHLCARRSRRRGPHRSARPPQPSPARNRWKSPALAANLFGDQETELASTRCDLEDALAGLPDPGSPQAIRSLARSPPSSLVPVPPARGHLAPDPPALLTIGIRIEHFNLPRFICLPSLEANRSPARPACFLRAPAALISGALAGTDHSCVKTDPGTRRD